MKWIEIKLEKYPVATLSIILAVGAFSGAWDFAKFTLINFYKAAGIGIAEFVSFYILIKILKWLKVL